MQAKILSNAVWNAINGSSSAVVAVLVPPFLTRLLTPEVYGAWALALQIGTYVSLFGFGIQMAVGRYVAYAEAREDYVQRDGIVVTAFWFLVGASTIGWVAICGVALSIDRLVPSLSPALIVQTRVAIILVGLALAINLPSSVFAAVFTGRMESQVPAKIQGLGRILLAIGLVAAGFSRNLAVLGLIYAIISIGTVIALGYAWRKHTHAPTLSLLRASTEHARELASFCLSLTLWNFAMLLIGGLDLLIVGRYDYAATAFFAVSVTLVTLINGTLGSLASALVPATAGLQDDAQGTVLRRLLLRGSRLIVAASIIAGTPLILNGRTLLGWWIGNRYADSAAAILMFLATATVVRNSVLTYVTIAIGTGYQRKMTVTPLIEGMVSIILSFLLVHSMGAVGVAAAKIASGLVGVTLVILQHPLKPVLGGMSRRSLFLHCVLLPWLAAIPIVVVGTALNYVLGGAYGWVGLLLTCSTAVISVWLFGISAEDRRFVHTLFESRFGQRGLSAS